jgi:predicted nucleotidyltransferase
LVKEGFVELSRAGAELLGDTEAATLRVLARVHEPISGRELARRAETSPSTTRRVLERLQQAGLVHARPSSHALLYTANREHVLWEPVDALLTGLTRLEDELSSVVDERTHQTATLAVFGSVARGEAIAASDLDLVLVLADETAGDEREALVDELTDLIERRTGNPAQVLALTRRQLRNMVVHADPLIDSLTRDARTLTGTPLETLISRARTAAA